MKESVEKYKTSKTPEEVNLDRKNYTSEELEKMYNCGTVQNRLKN